MNNKVQTLFRGNQQQALLRLLQLTSPTFPVGSYAYSQGLEWVVEADWISDADSLQCWLKGVMQGSLCHVDIPIMQRLYQACRDNDETMMQHWNDMLLAYRETSELRKEELDKGHAIGELLKGLNISDEIKPLEDQQSTFLIGYCRAAVAWQIELEEAAQGYVWGWLENQLVSAMKIMPLGQIASQKILDNLISDIPNIVDTGLQLDDDEMGALLPAQAIACAKHETQYSRLFRS